MFQLNREEVAAINSRIIQQDIIQAARNNQGITLDRMQAAEVCYLLEKNWAWDKVGSCYYEIKRAIKATSK